MPKIEKHDLDMKANIDAMYLANQLIKDGSDLDVQIELLIREKYSMSQETMLHRKKLMGTLEDDVWNEYCEYVEECIEKAQEQPE